MKKLLLAIAAVVMLASCAKDDIQLETKQATVSFNVTSPAVATRYGEGTTATKLYWATYDEEEGLISGLCGDKEFSLNTNVELSLVQGRSYEVIFWAQAEGAPFTRTWGNVATEAQITINDMANLTANEESYDAFFGYIDLGEVSGSTLHDVDLVRPFAQLNVATADITKAENADLDVARTGIEVTGVYSSLRLFDGAVLGDRTTAKFALAKKAEGKVKTNGKEYDYLSMNYLLVKEKALVDVKLSLQDSEANVKVLTRNYTSVPVQRNYRTNIVGNILTSDTEFSIEVKPGFEEDGFGVIDGKIFQYVNNAAEFFAALDNTEVEIIILTEDIDLNNQAADVASRAGEDLRQVVIPADRTVTIDLNGKTLSQTKRQTSAYSMITNDGNLTIIDGKQGGKISYTDTGNGGTYESNTITNRGTITIKSGTIENLSSVAVGQNGYPYVIDTSIWGSAQEVVVNVEDGKLYSEGYSAIRVRIDSEKPVIANVSGGEVIGTIEVHKASATDGIVGSLNISGGKISNNATANAIYIFGQNGDASNINVAISDGEIIGKIFVWDSIGTGFNRQFITGGTFHDASALNYLADGAEIKLGDDMELAADATITFPAEQSFTIDLNENTLSGRSTTTGKNYNMFDVRGTLSVKNGNITYEHTGENMAYNNFAEIFYVCFNGALELDGVTAKNLGGSDMAYVVDMVNATDITVNVNNSALESTYIPVRVFNNTTGVNNVTIKNSSLAGKYCFWVQYWLADGRDEETLQNSVKLDIFNTEGEDSNNNTFTYNNKYDAPVLFGNSKFIPIDQYGNKISVLTEVAEGISADGDGNYVITAAEGLDYIRTNISAEGIDGFAGKTITLEGDIDLTAVEDFAPIAAGTRDDSNAVGTGFKGIFDGAGKTIDGLKITSGEKDDAIGLFGIINGGEVKNVIFTNVEINAPKCENAGTVAGLVVNGGKISGVTIESGSVTAKRGNGGIAGRMMLNGTIEECTNKASISGTGSNVAGIVGAAYYTNAEGTLTIKNCTNHGSVTVAAGGVGGVAGLSAADIEGCKNYGEIIANGDSVGGIAGEQSHAGSVIGCFNYGNVTNNAGAATGGITGWTRYNGNSSDYARAEIIEISGNTNEGEIKGVNLVGGIAGQIFNYAILDGNTNKAPKITSTNTTDLNLGKAAGIVGYALCTYVQPQDGLTDELNVTLKNNTSTTTAENISGAVTNLIVNCNPNEYIHLEGNTPASN